MKRKFNYLAAAAGGTLGFVTNNVAGAYIGASLAGNIASYEPDQKKMKFSKKSKKTKSIGQGVSRSTMVTNYKKPKKTKRKTVKVSKYLRAAIKQVDAGVTAQGTYKHMFNGVIGVMEDVNTNPLPNADGNNPFFNQATIQTLENEAPTGGRTLFNQLLSIGNAYSGAGQTLSPGTDLNFFTPGKIINAASVLFNSKVATRLVYATTGNLSANSGNGVPLVTPGSLKIELVQSYVKVTLKNLSARPLVVEQWELAPKLKFYKKAPIEDVRALALSKIDKVTSGIEEHLSVEYATLQGNDRPFTELLQDGNIDPFKMLIPCGFQFTGQRKVMTLAPQELCSHYIKGPSGVLDYNKLFADGDFQNALLKKWSSSVVFGVRVEPVITDTGKLGRYGNFLATAPGRLSAPVTIEIEEVFKIKVPEVAGFIRQPLEETPTVGTTVQQLNLRKYRLSIGNFMELQGTANHQPIMFNEENPGVNFANAPSGPSFG